MEHRWPAGSRIGVRVRAGTVTAALVVDGRPKSQATVRVTGTGDPAVTDLLCELGSRAAVESVVWELSDVLAPATSGTRVAVLRIAPRRPVSPALGHHPAPLVRSLVGRQAVVRGGHDLFGTELTLLDVDAAIREARAAREEGFEALAVTATGAVGCAEHELRAAEIIAEELGPDFPVSLSHQVGALGLLERENATTLNASLLGVAERVVQGFHAALAEHGLSVASYLTQNDGTLMTAEEAVRFPILTVGSGPTNSMRGACALAGLTDALVIDVGGTSSDVGILVDGFPRESSAAVEVGGVRTNFRMPDLISIGLGGGTVVRPGPEGPRVGPDSVGYRVVDESLVRGGQTLTLSDISVRAGRLTGFGDVSRLSGVDSSVVSDALAWVDERIQVMCERMKASRAELPLIAVGGGSHLVPDVVTGASEVLRPEHYSVANAFGAAIAEASGAVDRVYRYEPKGRGACLAEARELASAAAVRAGADPDRLRITSVHEVPLSYLPGRACRVQVKAAGPLAGAAR
ncbi:MAG: Hydantoinase/oxoprolinase [Actinoallomurus sp.]|nr:Hydantoinase/oxoprolinase [Actinoallomurus sp.]